MVIKIAEMIALVFFVVFFSVSAFHFRNIVGWQIVARVSVDVMDPIPPEGILLTSSRSSL
jgi:hypothetical protein